MLQIAKILRNYNHTTKKTRKIEQTKGIFLRHNNIDIFIMAELNEVGPVVIPNGRKVEKPKPMVYEPAPLTPTQQSFNQQAAARNIFLRPQKTAAEQMMDAAKVNDTLEEKMAKYNAGLVSQRKQTNENTRPIDPNSETDGLREILYTSPQQEEEMRKASVQRQRIMAVGDALRQIGNIYHTVQGAPSQQLNMPSLEERQRYLQEKAIRDNNNMRYMTYQQAKAAQDAKIKQWEQQYQLNAANAASQHAYRQRQAEIAAGNAASQDAYRRGNLARQEAADKARNDYNERKLKQQTAYQNRMAGYAGMNAQSNRMRANAYVNRQNGAGGSGVAPLDTPKGQITPNGKNYSNQLLQMFDYAKSKGYVQESDVARRLRELGFGKDQSDNVKRQMVMDLLRTNQDMGDYASSRLGWSYGAGVGGGMDLGLDDDEEDEMDLGLE